MISYFLGANSPGGFLSLYDRLIDLSDAADVCILKGGPGCGKSTLMRTVAAAAEEAGQPVEYIRCSGDPDSLDGIVLPRQKAAIVDGTAPHVVEPTLPGVVERYLNLGDCYDKAALSEQREEISGCMTGYKACYSRAYRCLRAAAEISANCRSILQTDLLNEKIVRRARGMIARELRKKSGGSGQITERFLSAVTCQGQLCEWGTVQAQCPQVYELEDTYGLAHPFLSALLTAAVAMGHDAVACPSPMASDRLEHLLLPGLGLAFVTSSPELPYPGKAYRRIRLDAMVDPDLLRRSRPRLRFSRKVAAALTEEAVLSLAEAKVMHDALEALYNPHVDFDRVHALAQSLSRQLHLVEPIADAERRRQIMM